MYRTYINDETGTTVIVNFEEMMEEYPEYQDECEDIIKSVGKKFSDVVESIDEPQDYYYVISCSTEDDAEDVENYVIEAFNDLEENIDNSW